VKTNFLTHINGPSDLRLLTEKDLPLLAKELREFIIDIVATKEGHLGASLGVVELTIALHYVFQTPKDNLIWDVGHQAYGHKILTGRRDVFYTNRQFKGIAGFPNREESEYDSFGTGHSSTSISAALGMAMAANLKGEKEKQHIAVIGDASIASGMAFEALNHAGVSKANLLIVLNDNEMGIDPNVGALKEYLSGIKNGDQADERNLFEAFNFAYSGPIDGHDLVALVSALTSLKKIKGPKFLHVITTKGKGLEKAEKDQVTYHAPGKFDKVTGEIIPKNTSNLPPKYQDVFGETILELAQKNTKIVGITPAMPTGSSLKLMIEAMPHRAFDVGIAEQHAVTLAAGMAAEGIMPFCTIYSTFLQRAYDQVIHDVALQNLPVIFCLDRAGLVGEDGATHHGVFDIAYLRCIPNLCIFAPMNVMELRNIMYTAQLGLDFPIAIRYPRGRGEMLDWKSDFESIEIGKAVQVSQGSEVAVLTVGAIGNTVVKVLEAVNSDKLAHFNMRFIKPLDEKLLHHICSTFKKIVTIEDGTVVGGFGTSILEFASDNSYTIPVERLGIPDQFITHGSTEILNESIGLSKVALMRFFQSINY